MVSYALLLLLLLIDGRVHAQEAGRELAEDQIAWFRNEGGYLSDKIDTRPIFDSADAPLGLFANEAFSKGETIMVVPRKLLLSAGPDSESLCDTTINLLKEYLLKDESYYAPYVKYLFSKTDVPLPSAWSQAGKELLEKIRGENLPPYDLTHNTFENNCGGDGNDELLEFAWRTVVSRGWNDILVPVLDMINHRRGRYRNTDSTLVHGKDDIKVYALREIPADEQLFVSYSELPDEIEWENDYVLPHLIRDFGFVDDYPQRWNFPVDEDVSLVFDIDFVNEEAESLYKDGSVVSPAMKVTWRTVEPTIPQLMVLKEELSRVLELEPYVAENLEKLDSARERMVTKDYFQSLKLALRYAIGIYDKEDESCSSAYDFEELKAWMDCEDYAIASGYQRIYNVHSHFQHIEVTYGRKEEDACLYLNGHLHACASNRPHYHEIFVHYAARYLNEVKRVIFIGGGDAMVLHEVLKYPSLELVVGLELDREVTVATYAMFGAEPHYENEKVLWYYGDAAKSMLVLPRDYYGSFDLVIVDLRSDVAQILKVNDELTLTEAATLLMKPEGIIIRNEDEGYIPGSRKVTTKYSLDVVFHDTPQWCIQTFAMGSNSVDFFTATPKDHNVKTLYLEGIESFKSQFDSWYNFGTNEKGAQILCEKNEATPSHSKQVTKAFGVLLVLEAEDISLSLDSTETIQSAISQALNNAGLPQPVVSYYTYSYGFYIGMFFDENYVIARCIPESHYCAFDVQLFGDNIEKLDRLKTGLLSALQSEKSSSYRFVTDGILTAGVEHSEKVGPPRINDLCRNETERVQESGPGTMIREKKLASEFGEATYFTLHSYVNTRFSNEWKSQRQLAIEAVFKFHDSEATHKMNNIQLAEFMNETVVHVCEYYTTDSDSCVAEQHGTHTFTTRWTTGDISGRYNEETSGIEFTIFILSLKDTGGVIYQMIEEEIWSDSRMEEWRLSRFDVFPRGTGNVVNYREAVESIPNHKWLEPKER